MRRVIDPEPLPGVKGRFSQAMQSDPFVFLAGMIASDFDTGLDPAVRPTPGLPYHGVPIKQQTEFVLSRQQRVARAAATGLDRAAHVWSLLTDVGDFALVQEARRRFFDPTAWPAGSTYGVQALTVAGGKIEVDAILATPGADREVIRCRRLRQPPVEFGVSHGVRVGPYVFVSSQAAVDFETGLAPEARAPRGFPHFWSGVKRQAEYILGGLGAILAEAGTSLDNVVKTQVFLPDLGNFAELEEVWQHFFPKDPPARSVIPARLTIPECLVEINAIAIIPDGRTRKEIVHTDRAPRPSIHEPQAVKAGPFVFLSQLLATDYKNGVAPEGRVNPQFPNHESEVRRQLNYIFANADAILEAAGSSIKHLVRRQGYYSTFEDNLPGARDVTLATFLPDPSPSTNVSLGTGLLVPGCVYLFDAIGVTK